MPETVRVMVQMRSTPSLAMASFGPAPTGPILASLSGLAGVHFDNSFSPVPIPPAQSAGKALTMSALSKPGPTTYIMRAAVERDAFAKFLDRANKDPAVAGVFADPRIQPIATCPSGPIGTDRDIEDLLLVEKLHQLGMDGAGVRVAIVDTGVNLDYLKTRGKTPHFDKDLSWSPNAGQAPGQMPVDHGTMCGYDVCIAAPACTLVDHAVLASTSTGGSVMDGLLSDAVQSYALLLSYLTKAPQPFAGDHTPRTLVVNNSWGMFHPSWDFPVGNPQNYSDNPAHPFNIIVASLESAGADILFAAGNCGPECPDDRCQNATNEGIYGANSSAAVTCVAGVTRDKDRLGYSTKGPGRLEKQKPDISSFTHFAGSGVYAADGGTSAATPVAAGLVAAIRRLYPASVLPPVQLRQLLRDTADQPGGAAGFNYEYGYGIVNVAKLLERLAASAPGQAFKPAPAAAHAKPKKKKPAAK
jgi:subtilisin family serine protease